MKQIILIIIITILSIGLNSCTDTDSLIDGKYNALKLKHLKLSLEQNPNDKILQDSVKLYEMYVKINRENYASYGMGSNDDFNREIDRYLKTCK